MTTSPVVMFSTRFLDDQTRHFLEQHAELRQLDPALYPNESTMSATELAAALHGVSGWILGHPIVDRAVLECIPSVKVIARRGVGYEKVDAQAAGELGKVVTIARGGNEDTVADHTIALMLGVGRRLRESHNEMIANRWSILLGTDLFGKTVGLFGDGWIARKVIQRLKGFDVRTLVHTRRPDADYAAKHDIEYVSFERLLEESDYLSLHAPLNNETRGLIGRDTLKRMQPTSILINTARAQLIDEAALLSALEENTIAGAGLDVLCGETDLSQRPLAAKLLALPNVLVTPHAAASTHEALARTNMVAARSVIDVLEGRMPPRQCIVVDGRTKGKS